MHNRPEFEGKLCEPAQLAGRIAALERPLVFTNGVFDILHRGHVTYLAQARALGASLIVAANSDASARRLGKGEDRPINRLEDRMAVLAALQAVDLVTWFDEDTPLALILACRPDVLVKGGDWKARGHRRREGSHRLGRRGALDPVPVPALDHRDPEQDTRRSCNNGGGGKKTAGGKNRTGGGPGPPPHKKQKKKKQ